MNRRKVTKQEFYAALYAASTPANDIMPRIVGSKYPFETEWRNQKDRNAPLFGVSNGDEFVLCEKEVEKDTTPT